MPDIDQQFTELFNSISHHVQDLQERADRAALTKDERAAIDKDVIEQGSAAYGWIDKSVEMQKVEPRVAIAQVKTITDQLKGDLKLKFLAGMSQHAKNNQAYRTDPANPTKVIPVYYPEDAGKRINAVLRFVGQERKTLKLTKDN